MYFGFELMWTLTFIPLGFAIVTVASLAFGCVYFVGASRGGAAAMRFTRIVGWAFVVALAADLVYGIAAGQWSRFFEWYGAGPMIEIVLLAFMWVMSMWLMAISYSRGRVREDAGGAHA